MRIPRRIAKASAWCLLELPEIADASLAHAGEASKFHRFIPPADGPTLKFVQDEGATRATEGAVLRTARGPRIAASAAAGAGTAGLDETYLARKRAEISLLDACLASPLAPPAPRSVAEVIEQKLKLAAALRAERALQSWAITETARADAQRWNAGAWRFAFGYQRADLDVRGPPIYPALDAHRRELAIDTLYTSSGMSAIAALLTGLAQARGAVGLEMAPGGYGETRELVRRLAGRVRTVSSRQRAGTGDPGEARVLWIDSACRRGFRSSRARTAAPFDLVACDTTCWWQDSARIRRVVDAVLASGRPLALVRSHAKLDSLGIEYGRLGSIVLATPRRARPALMRDLVREVRDAIRLLGVAAIPAHFPPFTGSDDYRRQSASRVAAIVRNTRLLARRLGLTPLADGLATYRHGLYLTLAPRGELRIRDVRRAVDALCAALVETGLPVRHAGSFGFDFVAIEWFTDPQSRRNVIRVAPGDLPRPVIERVADGIVAWFSRQGPRVAGSAAGPAIAEVLAA